MHADVKQLISYIIQIYKRYVPPILDRIDCYIELSYTRHAQTLALHFFISPSLSSLHFQKKEREEGGEGGGGGADVALQTCDSTHTQLKII